MVANDAPPVVVTWLLGLLAAFVFLGTRRQSSSDNVHLLALALILVAVAVKTVVYHLS